MNLLIALFVLAQLILAVRVVRQFLRAGAQKTIPSSDEPGALSVSIIMPVLDEERRISKALDALLIEAQGTHEIIEILVVDGGSADRTVEIVEDYRKREGRLRVVDASPVPNDVVGKAWGLHQGLGQVRGDWVLTIDADTLVGRGLTRALINFVQQEEVDALSVATEQATAGMMGAMLHPALLTTLVYRFGPPGFITRDQNRVIANGQCFFAAKDALQSSQAIQTSLSSLCEEITIVRTLAHSGYSVGFFECDVPVRVEMYSTTQEMWRNWPRSLVMKDQYFGVGSIIQLARVLLLQAAPLPLIILALVLSWPLWFVVAQLVFVSLRLGVLFGTRKAYTACAPTFWLSPLLDGPAALKLLQMAFKRRLEWRGRVYVRGADGRLKAVDDGQVRP